jgi:hypothetical protein
VHVQEVKEERAMNGGSENIATVIIFTIITDDQDAPKAVLYPSRR